MTCFRCRRTGEKMCEGSCGLGCPDCPDEQETPDYLEDWT
jgi:hypothetical protein